MYLYDGKVEFSAELLKFSVSHDLSEIILICWFSQETFLIIINVEISCDAWYFCGNHIIVSGFSD